MNQTTWLQRRVLARLGAGLALLGALLKARPAAALQPAADKAGPHYRESPHVQQFYKVNRY